MLLVCGDRDTVVPPRHTQMLQAGLPSAGVVVLEGCGHVPSYTHPEAFAEVVRQFLTPPARPGETAACARRDGIRCRARGDSRQLGLLPKSVSILIGSR